MDILNFLASALMQQGAFNPRGASPDVEEEIVVQGARAPFELDPDPTFVRRGEPYREFGPRQGGKGMFGIKGTMRDVLGLLGDSLLVGNDVSPVYAPRRQQENISEALEVYRKDPALGQQLLDRVAPEMSQKMAENARRESLDQQRINQQLRATESLERERRLKSFGTIAQYANAARDESSYQRMKPILQEYINDNGLNFPLPDKYDPNIIQDLLKAAIGPVQEQSLDIRAQNAQTAAARTAGNLALGQGRLGVAKQQADIAQQRTDIYRDDVRSRINTRENPPNQRKRMTGQGAAPPSRIPPGAVDLGGGVFRLADGTFANAQGVPLRPKVK
jgi:hypothetical protein